VECPALPLRLQAADVQHVVVSYRPGPDTPTSNTLEFETDDPTEPLSHVALRLPPSSPFLVMAPTSLEFGAVASGEIVTRELRVENLGLGPARSLRLEWDRASSDFSAPLPATELGPGKSVTLAVSYAPQGGNSDSGLLRVEWSEGHQLIPVSGWQDLRAPE
jgi:hypothetical protein